MRIRIAYSKIRKQIDDDIQEFVNQLKETTLKNVVNTETMTDSEKVEANKLMKQADTEYKEFVYQKGLETIECSIDDSFTEEEYEEIVDVNAANDVEINNIKISAADLLETFYVLFVNE